MSSCRFCVFLLKTPFEIFQFTFLFLEILALIDTSIRTGYNTYSHSIRFLSLMEGNLIEVSVMEEYNLLSSCRTKDKVFLTGCFINLMFIGFDGFVC